jgi:heavy metal sensor kinase
MRFRLTVWNTLVLLAAVLGALMGVREGLRRTLYGELDELLEEDAGEVALMARDIASTRRLAEELQRKAVSHAEHDWFGEIRDPEGRTLASGGTVPEGLAAAGPSPADEAGHRIVRRTVDLRRGRFEVRVGAAVGYIDRDVDRLTNMIAAALAVVVLAAPVGGWLLAGRVVRPLAGLLAAADRLDPQRYGERLASRGTGDEVDQIAATINGLLARLAGFVERQRAFLADAAHELRSPLNALRSRIELTLARPRSASEYEEAMADLAEECTRLETLVHQLLLLAEADAGRTRCDGPPVRLDAIAVRTCEMFAGVAEQRGVGLTCDASPAQVAGDAGHLRRVVQNLIDNALKFTPAGGRVAVSVAPASAETGGRVRLRVADTGIGIGPEDLPHVFERFYRADKARRRGDGAGGSGLGLSICRAIVNAVGGTISVDSRPGEGTTMTVELPTMPSE